MVRSTGNPMERGKRSFQPAPPGGSESAYEGAVRLHVHPHVGLIRLAELSALHVQRMVAKIKSGQRTKALAYTVLKAALSHAVRLRLIDVNPCDAVPKPKQQRETIDPFTADEVAKILEATEGDRLHALYVVAFTTGLRQGELFGLRTSDVDLDDGRLHVRQQARELKGRVTMKPPKTRSGVRSIQLTDRTVKALVERRAASLREGHAGCDLVFTNQRGRVIHRSNFGTRQWRPLLKRLGLSHRGFHHVRHTAATMMLDAGVPIHTVSRILGHARVSVTLDTYAHVMHDQADEVAAKIARIIG